MSSMVAKAIVYTVPELDDDVSDDNDTIRVSYKRQCDLEKQEKVLIRLGCSFSLLQEFKRLHSSSQIKHVDESYDIKYRELQSKIQKEREEIIKSLRQKKQEDLNKYKSQISLPVIDEDAEDKKFEEELKKQRKLIDDAIALDKKKLEEKSAQQKAQEEKEKKETEAKKLEAKQLKEKNEKISKLQQSAATSPEGLEEYKKYYAKIEHYKTVIRPKLEDAAFRKQCFEARKLIKRTVAQLQPNHNTILEKYNVMNNHLMGIKQQNEDAFQVMLNFLAKVFLLQVKQEIHATPHAAYFLARFAYLICCSIPEFMDYLLGRLMKRCPYLIPQYHDDDPTLSHDEIRKRLRYTIANKEKKILETFLQHAEGQKCFVMFYGALTQTMPDPGQPPNPFPIKHAWIYLARICNMPPREITPFLTMGLLEITGKRLLEAYPNQTRKVLLLIKETIIPLYPKSADDGNVSTIKRLEMFLDGYFKTGRAECVPETLESKV